KYNEVNFRRMRREAAEFGGPETLKEAPVAELMNARFEIDDEQVFDMPQGSSCCARLDVRFHADADDPIFAIALLNEKGATAFAASTQLTYGPTGQFRAGEIAMVRIRFDNLLAPGHYRLLASVARAGMQVQPYDARQDIASIVVYSTTAAGGAVDLPH